MQLTQIKNLKQGESVYGIYILRNKELKEASNKKQYIALIFIDSTGEISGKIWDVNETLYNSLNLNKLYKIYAKVDSWKETLQLNIIKIQLAEQSIQNRIAEFVPSAPLPPEVMLREVYSYASKIDNTDIRRLVLKLLKDKEDKLLFYPAARSLHHSVRSGLLYHIVRMLKVAEKLKDVYDEINIGLLYAGVLIHDLAKIGELESDELGFSEYSKEGQLLGHLLMGIRDIEISGRELGISSEVILLLQHMVAGHHYEPEYGSPKKPMFLEAELLHYIDMIDARVYDYDNILKNIEKGSFSEPVWSLDRRRLYKIDL
ncbi:MAG: HD domain-containing protein [Clostridiaceae bacterium]|jgi:3'-5' exoribonuclease|nr:HD domain-containing protein [Clostridiaceae bacterium]